MKRVVYDNQHDGINQKERKKKNPKIESMLIHLIHEPVNAISNLQAHKYWKEIRHIFSAFYFITTMNAVAILKLNEQIFFLTLYFPQVFVSVVLTVITTLS